MSKLGSPITNSFSIGTAELRIGPLASAAKLTQASSVGLVDNAELSFTAEAIDLFGGFPQTIVDTAIVKQTGNIKAQIREFSQRNLNLALGNGASSTAVVDVKSTLATASDVALGATSITLAAGGGASFSIGDVISIYPTGRPEDVTITIISAIAVDTLTLQTGLPTLVAYPATNTAIPINVFKSFGVAAGNVTQTNYFSLMLLQNSLHSGRPQVWCVWKAANTGTMTQKTTAAEYGMLDLDIKILQPTASDIAVGGSLNGVAALVNSFPAAARFGGADI